MTKEELLKKDWQLLTAYSNITTISKLETILENQAVIISHLKNIPIDSVLKQMNEFEKDNYVKIQKDVKDNIPDYPAIERTYK